MPQILPELVKDPKQIERNFNHGEYLGLVSFSGHSILEYSSVTQSIYDLISQQISQESGTSEIYDPDVCPNLKVYWNPTSHVLNILYSEQTRLTRWLSKLEPKFNLKTYEYRSLRFRPILNADLLQRVQNSLKSQTKDYTLMREIGRIQIEN